MKRIASITLLCAALTFLLTSCKSKVEDRGPTTPPPAAFTGPAFLHGTVGSMAILEGFQPLPVSGFGLVVRLNGTGSPQVPPYLETWLLQKMRREGMGSARLRTQNLNPRRVLASREVAVVRVDGLIPPGAVKGSRFDLLVTAIEGTDTISLQGGQLWSTELAIDGANPDMRFRHVAAGGNGPIYLGALEAGRVEGNAVDAFDMRTSGVVLSGGAVQVERRLQLILNQASWNRSQIIADRINNRFPRGVHDKVDTAIAKTDTIVEVNVPRAYRANTYALLNLIRHLYVQRAPNFEQEQAKRLAQVLISQPKYADRVGPAWVSLSRTIVPVLRELYEHPDMTVRLTALEAGCQLEDGLATEHVANLVQSGDAEQRRRAAEMLVYLPRNIAAARVLATLLDDADRSVRVTAYRSLAQINDPMLDRVPIGERENFKFLLDLVPAQRPMVFVSSTSVPRIVVFNPNLGFQMPLLARVWDNRLMLRAPSVQEPMTVYYQPVSPPDAEQLQPVTRQVAPALANLVRILSQPYDPSPDRDGLDLSYSQVVSAIHHLHKAGHLDCDLVIEESDLAQEVARQLAEQKLETRPELSPTAPPADTPPPMGPQPEAQPVETQNSQPDAQRVGTMPLP